MGTLIFHILLFSVFILAEIDMKGNVKEEELLIEFPDLIPEPEELPEEANDTENSMEDQGADLTNVASNRMATENVTESADDFFDEEFLREVEAAKQLVSNVNEQLSKETVDLEEIEMPVETTEHMDPDSIDNVVYVGESNIIYYLENRYHMRLPIPVYLAQTGGKVVVDIVVNRQGTVIEAEPRRSSSVRNEQLYIYSKAAAIRTRFNADTGAPGRQKGTIHYTFQSQ